MWIGGGGAGQWVCGNRCAAGTGTSAVVRKSQVGVVWSCEEEKVERERWLEWLGL